MSNKTASLYASLCNAELYVSNAVSAKVVASHSMLLYLIAKSQLNLTKLSQNIHSVCSVEECG